MHNRSHTHCRRHLTQPPGQRLPCHGAFGCFRQLARLQSQDRQDRFQQPLGFRLSMRPVGLSLIRCPCIFNPDSSRHTGTILLSLTSSVHSFPRTPGPLNNRLCVDQSDRAQPAARRAGCDPAVQQNAILRYELSRRTTAVLCLLLQRVGSCGFPHQAKRRKGRMEEFRRAPRASLRAIFLLPFAGRLLPSPHA